jgi:predicted nucleotidyltransferase
MCDFLFESCWLVGLVLVRLTEKIRSALEKLVRNMSQRETISGVGLFGSWGRGDAVAESDVDLLVVERQGALHERVDRLESDGLFVDLDYLPRRWVTVSLPPDIDQKMFEVLILYDRDWSLTNAKDWMSRSYRKLERVRIRSEMYLVDADIYLSRASSALARNDFQSAVVFAGLGLESILKIVVEAGLLPFSLSRFVHVLDESTTKLSCRQFFDAFVDVSRLASVSRLDVDQSLGLFKTVWDDMASALQEEESMLDSVHFRIRSQLNYYLNPSFLLGMLTRSQGMIDSGEYVEACHYVRRVLIDILENYAWFAVALEGKRLDSARLFKSLRTLKETPSELHENLVSAFGIPNLTHTEAEEAVKLAKESILEVRETRNELLRNAVKVT